MTLASRLSRVGARAIAASSVAVVAALSATGAHAQTPPPGALFDLAVTHPTPLAAYQQFSFSFVAGTANTTVSFAFREIPAYFAFDDASVSLHSGGANLLADPGFESGVFGQTTPTGWGRFIQPITHSAIGQVATSTQTYGCNVAAHGGTNFWCDGSVEGYDGLFQTVATTIGQQYDVSFWLQDDSGVSIVNPGIDMLGYAAAGLPVGTVPVNPVPEPETYALMLAGLAALGAVARRRKSTGKAA